MPFILSNFVSDVRTYGWSVAWYNVRFLLATDFLTAMIGPAYVHAHAACDGDCVCNGDCCDNCPTGGCD